MSPQLFTRTQIHDLKPVHPSREIRVPALDRAARPQLTAQQAETVHRLLQELFQSLTVLGTTSDLALTGQVTTAMDQAVRARLHQHARQAEAAMHTLRDMRLTVSPILTDLSQSLTVLVLAADMLTDGQLSGAEALSFYDLLRRNADTTMKCLNHLYVDFGLESASA
jgi:hypothetical protein